MGLWAAVKRGYAAYVRWFRLDDGTVEMATSSNFLKEKVHFALRVILCAYILAALVTSLTENTPYWIVLFTYLSYSNLLLYFLLVVGIQIYRFRKPDSLKSSHFIIHVCWVCFQMALVAHFIIPILYWTLLVPDLSLFTSKRWFVGLSVHVLDFVMVIIEFVFSKWRVESRHVLYCYVLAWLYIVFTILYHSIYNIFPYPFLDYTKAINLAFYFGLTTAVFPIFFAYQFFQLARDRQLRCCRGNKNDDVALEDVGNAAEEKGSGYPQV